MKRIIVLVLLLSIGSGLLVSAVVLTALETEVEFNALKLNYDVRIGIFKVGKMLLTASFDDESYELEGGLEAGGPIEKLLNLQGDFVVTGTFSDGVPATEKYVLIEEEKNKDERKVITVENGSTTVEETGKEIVEFATPNGNDLMTTLFMHSECQEEMEVFEDDESFIVKLEREVAHRKIWQGRKHYSGMTTLCNYEFVYKKDEVRKIDIWLGEVNGRVVPVRIKFRVPVLPNGLFTLRTTD